MSLGAELSDVKRDLETHYARVEQRGSDRAAFVVVHLESHSAVVAVDEDGWLVELWQADPDHPGEEIAVEETIINNSHDAIKHIRDWLGIERDEQMRRPEIGPQNEPVPGP
jgi:hypothetical protein